LGRRTGCERRTGHEPRSDGWRKANFLDRGPNGSGKSSLYGNTEIEAFDQSVWIINPDLLTQRIRQVEKLALEEANVQAVVRIEAWVEASIRAHQTVGVETVLSTAKYRRLVTEAKSREFAFRIIFVMLDSPDLNVQRVRLRVEKGGHDVPEPKIRERWTKSLHQLPWFLQQADQAAIFNNSGAVPQLIGQKQRDKIVIDPNAPRALREALGLIG
jgi:predicted ABC-type ATPase